MDIYQNIINKLLEFKDDIEFSKLINDIQLIYQMRVNNRIDNNLINEIISKYNEEIGEIANIEKSFFSSDKNTNDITIDTYFLSLLKVAILKFIKKGLIEDSKKVLLGYSNILDLISLLDSIAKKQ